MPGADGAVLNPDKILRYLLNDAHPDGRSKATSFRRFGFRPEAWAVLRAALLAHPLRNPVAEAVETEFGPRWVVRCSLLSPDGRDPCIATVWQADAPGAPPRLLTAYPD